MSTIHEPDEWSTAGPSIISSENLELLKHVLDDVAPVVVEHWHYRGSRAPSRLIFNSYDQLDEYLRTATAPGDLFYMWNFTACCHPDNLLTTGKLPDAAGRVPKRGAY